MNKSVSRSLTFILSAFLVISDQISKLLIVYNIRENSIGYSFWTDFLWIIHVKNKGIAFSMGDSLPDVFSQSYDDDRYDHRHNNWHKQLSVLLLLVLLLFLVWIYDTNLRYCSLGHFGSSHILSDYRDTPLSELILLRPIFNSDMLEKQAIQIVT